MREFFSMLLGLLFMVSFASAQDRQTSWNDPVAQWAKIKFSHKQHIVDVGAECSTCHAAADSSERAEELLFPKHAECSGCHAEVESENTDDCKFCHTDVDNLEAFALPNREDIVFNHKQHIAGQQLECATCHAGIEQSEAPSVAYLPVMASCNSCHNEVKATNACESCHPRVETMLPLSHRVPDWSEQHKRLVRADHTTSDCASCHTDNFCQTCHAEAT
ncbi:hypothetical protein DWB58_17840, partial [candidate division KSB1 bacterium]|nr:hypothetical protein [candidate division KSB1 bacterium]